MPPKSGLQKDLVDTFETLHSMPSFTSCNVYKENRSAIHILNNSSVRLHPKLKKWQSSGTRRLSILEERRNEEQIILDVHQGGKTRMQVFLYTDNTLVKSSLKSIFEAMTDDKKMIESKLNYTCAILDFEISSTISRMHLQWEAGKRPKCERTKYKEADDRILRIVQS
uniref:Uncharacterized protein n=1 Tax=Ditylenchus dipsaci TaxID=166011 RepID=A0A915DJI7_9BILA